MPNGRWVEKRFVVLLEPISASHFYLLSLLSPDIWIIDLSTFSLQSATLSMNLCMFAEMFPPSDYQVLVGMKHDCIVFCHDTASTLHETNLWSSHRMCRTPQSCQSYHGYQIWRLPCQLMVQGIAVPCILGSTKWSFQPTQVVWWKKKHQTPTSKPKVD